MLRLVVYLVLLAVVIYAFFWLIDRRNAGPGKRPGGGSGGGRPGGRPSPRGPVGPDDDEDFLRELDRKRWHRHNSEDES